MDWTICGLTAQPGEKVQGYFAGPNGENTIPLCLIHGTKPGKTVLLTAGVHACEYPGAAAVMELCRTLEPDAVSGRLILVPMLNVSSFYDRLPFMVKEDGKNLNRMFPGDPKGSYSQQLAAQIHRELHAKADYLIDIHSGDVPEMVMPFVYYPALAEPKVLEESRRMCRAMSVSCRVASVSMTGTSGTAAAIGIPSVLIERGGQWLLAASATAWRRISRRGVLGAPHRFLWGSSSGSDRSLGWLSAVWHRSIGGPGWRFSVGAGTISQQINKNPPAHRYRSRRVFLLLKKRDAPSGTSLFWCEGWDLNPHSIATASTSSWCVCHSATLARNDIDYTIPF